MTGTEQGTVCQSCGSAGVRVFFEVTRVPTNSVLLLTSQQDAVDAPRGDIRLGHCPLCGHVQNAAFESRLTEYSGRYESTQGYSPTFNRFHQALAHDVVERFDVRGKTVLEIGCGNGEFLTMLCKAGGNKGIGFDPAFIQGRVPVSPGIDVDFVADFYSEQYGNLEADFVVCKMTLEHIFDTGRFVHMVRAAVGSNPETVIMFQVPNARYVLGDVAFWDVYYEHCSYFTAGSLARLFRQQHFDVFDVWTDYDDQYLMLAAHPAHGTTSASLDVEQDRDKVTAEVEDFERDVAGRIDQWRRTIADLADEGRTVVLWGGGSKGVAFITTLGVDEEIAAVVDINPNKADTYMAGSGHRIVSPSALIHIHPDLVIVMNPVYLGEVREELNGLGIDAEVVGLE